MGEIFTSPSRLFYQSTTILDLEVLIAICKEGKAMEITSSKFLNTYKLTASSVQGAIKGLLEKDFEQQSLEFIVFTTAFLTFG